MSRAIMGWLCRQSSHALVLVSLLLTGCASLPISLFQLEDFPPQKVIETGDFRGFSRGKSAQFVDMWRMDTMRYHLFNLGFVYATYPGVPIATFRSTAIPS